MAREVAVFRLKHEQSKRFRKKILFTVFTWTLDNTFEKPHSRANFIQETEKLRSAVNSHHAPGLVGFIMANKSEVPIPVYDTLVQIDALRWRRLAILSSQNSLKFRPILSEFDIMRRLLEIRIVPGKVAIEIPDTRVQIKVWINMLPILVFTLGPKNVAVDQSYALGGGREGAFNWVTSTHFRW